MPGLQLLAAVLGSSVKAFSVSLVTSNVVTGKDWNCNFDSGVNAVDCATTGSGGTDTQVLREPGSTSIVALVTLSGSLSEDCDIEWWRMPKGGSWTSVNTVSKLRTESVSSSYTFTSVQKEESFQVIVTPKPYNIDIQAVTMLGGGLWKAVFNGTPLTRTTVGTTSSTIPASSTSFNLTIVKRNSGDTSNQNVSDITSSVMRVAGTIQFTDGPVTVGNPFNFTHTITGCVPGDTIRAEINEG